MFSSPSSCLGTSWSPAAAEMDRLIWFWFECNPSLHFKVRLAELSVTGSLRSTKKLAQHRGPAHKMTLLPDSPYIVLSAGEDGQVLNFLESIEQNPQNVNFRCCRLISGSPSLTRYYFWGMKKTKRFDFTHCHPRFFQKFPPGANLQYPLLSHKFPPLLHLGQVALLSPSIHHNLKKLQLTGTSSSGCLTGDT